MRQRGNFYIELDPKFKRMVDGRINRYKKIIKQATGRCYSRKAYVVDLINYDIRNNIIDEILKLGG